MKKEIKFKFFGKDCVIDRALTKPEEFKQKLQNLGFKYDYNPLFLNQIHGNEVVVVDTPEKIYQSPFPKADALVTNIKNLPIIVITADCVPLIFYDEIHEIIAVAHAGWKGAKSGIIENTIEKMLSIGAKIENIKIQIGPCIRQKSYEISQEFHSDFVKDDVNNESFFIKGEKSGHFMFDLPQYCISRLEKFGITQIKDEKIDTYSNEEILFSYRRSTHRNEPDCGRNISVIVLN